MLELESPIWALLEGPYGSAEQVPKLLMRLQESYDQAIADELYTEYLFHQNTIYSSTLAAVPYLAELVRSSGDPEMQLDIFLTCGLFEASRDSAVEGDLPPQLQSLEAQAGRAVCQSIYTRYLSAATELKGYGDTVMRYAMETDKDHVEKRYVLAAVAAFGGRKGTSGVLTTFCEGDEYVASCQACGEEIYLWPSPEDDRLLAYRNDPVFEESQEARPVLPGEPSPGSGLAELRDHAVLIGEQRLLRHLPYLAGAVQCPSCEAQSVIWPGLTGLYEQA